MNPSELDALSVEELEKLLIQANTDATICYRFDEDEKAEEHSGVAYQVYRALQRKMGIEIHDPMTREDARKIMEAK